MVTLPSGHRVKPALALPVSPSTIAQPLMDASVGLRVNEDEEFAGLDLSQHGGNAYTV